MWQRPNWKFSKEKKVNREEWETFGECQTKEMGRVKERHRWLLHWALHSAASSGHTHGCKTSVFTGGRDTCKHEPWAGHTLKFDNCARPKKYPNHVTQDEAGHLIVSDWKLGRVRGISLFNNTHESLMFLSSILQIRVLAPLFLAQGGFTAH